MSKYIPYQTPMQYIASKVRPIKYLLGLYHSYNKFDSKQDHTGSDPRTKALPYFLGGFNPLISMRNDFLSTVKPYKSRYYVTRDLLQPLRGLGNVVNGLFNLTVTPVLFLINTIRYIKVAILNRSLSNFLYNMRLNITKNGGGFLNGITSIIRGTSQIVTTPLTLVLRMPLRGVITAVMGMPTFIESFQDKAKQLEYMINRTDRNLEDSVKIDRKMERIFYKIEKAKMRGQVLGAKKKDIKGALKNCTKFTVVNNDISGKEYIDNLENTHDSKESALTFLSYFSTKEFPTAEKKKPYQPIWVPSLD